MGFTIACAWPSLEGSRQSSDSGAGCRLSLQHTLDKSLLEWGTLQGGRAYLLHRGERNQALVFKECCGIDVHEGGQLVLGVAAAQLAKFHHIAPDNSRDTGETASHRANSSSTIMMTTTSKVLAGSYSSCRPQDALSSSIVPLHQITGIAYVSESMTCYTICVEV